MIVPGELVVKGALDTAFSILQTNVTGYVSVIFGLFTQSEQAKIANWLSGITLSPTIGYMSSNIQVKPVIAITTESEQEITSQQFIGSGLVSVAADMSLGTLYQEIYSTPYRSIYAVHLQAPTQGQLYWLQILVKWGLLSSRHWMEINELLYNTQVTATGLVPVNEDALQDNPVNYERVVLLTGDHIDSWMPAPATSPATVESVTLTVEPQEYTFQVG